MKRSQKFPISNKLLTKRSVSLCFHLKYRSSTVKAPNLKAIKQVPHATEKCGHNYRTTIDQFDNHLSDSGFKSNFYPDKRKSTDKLSTPKIEVPHMLSFVGGAFTVQLHKSAVCKMLCSM